MLAHSTTASPRSGCCRGGGRSLLVSLGLLLLLPCTSPPACAQQPDSTQSTEAFLAQVDRDLGATRPEAAALFRAAVHAANADRFVEAESLLTRVHELVPGLHEGHP